jgi:hypothetical protein
VTPSRARAMLMMFFGAQAARVFDPDWPETMLQLSPGARRDEVFRALRQRLSILASHPYGSGEEVEELRIVLKGIAAQMVDGPGSSWTDSLDAELGNVDGMMPRLTVMPTGKPDDVIASDQPEVDDDFAQHIVGLAGGHDRQPRHHAVDIAKLSIKRIGPRRAGAIDHLGGNALEHDP